MPGPGRFGFGASGELRPTPRLKRYYLRKANRQARKAYAPERQLYRRQLSQLRQRQRKEVQSVEGAISMFGDVVNDAQSGLQDSGLKGRYLKQVAGELAHRQADVAQSAPYLQQQIRQDYLPQRQDLQNAVLESRINQKQEAQSSFAQLVAGGMEEAQTAQAQNAAQRAEGGAQNPAIQAGLDAAALWHERWDRLVSTPNKKLSDEDLAQKKMIQAALEDPDYYWDELAATVAGTEGVNALQATRATALYRDQLAEQQARGLGNVASNVAGVAAQATKALPGPADSLYDLWMLTQRGRR